MKSKFNFNSQICTTREQSERLLALGLKKKTADMYMPPSWGGDKIIGYYAPDVVILDDHFDTYPNDLPAWSLDRLKELYKCVGDTSLWNLDDVNYDRLIQCISLAIKQNNFNKEYLV